MLFGKDKGTKYNWLEAGVNLSLSASGCISFHAMVVNSTKSMMINFDESEAQSCRISVSGYIHIYIYTTN